MDIPWNHIDKRLRPIIKRLNDMGLETSGCCQGADCYNMDQYRNEYEGSHHAQAYIQFIDRRDLPQKLIDRVRISPKLKYVPYVEGPEDFRCEIQSVSMLNNNKFHVELDTLLDRWEGKPMDAIEVEDVFEVLFSALAKKEKPGTKRTVDIETGVVTTSYAGAGKRSRNEDEDFLPWIEWCIDKEKVSIRDKEYAFITKEGKIQHTPISTYIWKETDIGKDYDDDRHLRRIVKRMLPRVEGIKRGKKGFYKK